MIISTGAKARKGHYVDFSPTVSAPFNISSYIKVIPQFALKETFWSRDDNSIGTENKNGDRTIYNASLALSSQISRVFDVNVQNWEKIQHDNKTGNNLFLRSQCVPK